MSIQTREPEASAATPSPTDRFSPVERVIGGILLVAGVVATAWVAPTALRYPMAAAVIASICAIGVGVVWQKSWAAIGLVALGLLLCSASVGYALIQGPSLPRFAWFFVPGAYFVWVGAHTIALDRQRMHARAATD